MIGTRHPRRIGQMLMVVLSAAAIALIALRLGLWTLWQYPAPVGDSVLFASLSHYGCTDGILHTPIFPMDEQARYTWHGITQPALFAALDVGCSNAGNFWALSLLTAATFIVCLLITRGVQPAWTRMAFAVAVAGLLIKQGFRPDGLAILLALLAEYWLVRKRVAFVVPLVLLAWTHAIGFVLYACYVALQYGRFWHSTWRTRWLPIVALGVGMNVLLLLLYPFPLAAHLHALLLQGDKVVHQRWGTLTYAFFTNAFYPGFGVAFALAYGLAVWRNRWLWLLLLPIWYFFLRAPALYYNVIPLFAVLLYQALRPDVAEGPVSGGQRALAAGDPVPGGQSALAAGDPVPAGQSALAAEGPVPGGQHALTAGDPAPGGQSALAAEGLVPAGQSALIAEDPVPAGQHALIAGGLLGVALLAVIGITQGVARDVVSKARFDGTLPQVVNLYNELHAQGYRYCRVPAFFTLFVPYDAFEKSYEPTLKECASAPPDQRLDLIASSGTGAGPPHCRVMQAPRPVGWLGRFFRSDSGYSVFICPKSS